MEILFLIYPLCQTYQSYEQKPQILGTFLENKVFKKVAHNNGKSDECDFSTKCICDIMAISNIKS